MNSVNIEDIDLNNLLKQNQEKAEKEKYEKYNPKDIFKKNINKNSTNDSKELLPVTIKEEKWYIKKSIFKK